MPHPSGSCLRVASRRILDNPPYYVDFPLDSSGDLVTETWLRWKEHDPAELAAALDPADAPAIYFDSGTNDAFLFHPFNEHFAIHLTSLGIAHEQQSYAGDFTFLLPQRFPISLNFLDDAMTNISAVDDEIPGRNGVLQAYPNPFNPRTNISFRLEQDTWVEVGVYDVTGRRVTILANGAHAAGTHTLTWNGHDAHGHDLPSGTYVVRLTTPSEEEATKVTLIE